MCWHVLPLDALRGDHAQPSISPSFRSGSASCPRRVDARDRHPRHRCVTCSQRGDAYSVDGERAWQLHAGFRWFGHTSADDVQPRRGSPRCSVRRRDVDAEHHSKQQPHGCGAVLLHRLSRLLQRDRAPRCVRDPQRDHDLHIACRRRTGHLLYTAIGWVHLLRKPLVRCG